MYYKLNSITILNTNTTILNIQRKQYIHKPVNIQQVISVQETKELSVICVHNVLLHDMLHLNVFPLHHISRVPQKHGYNSSFCSRWKAVFHVWLRRRCRGHRLFCFLTTCSVFLTQSPFLLQLVEHKMEREAGSISRAASRRERQQQNARKTTTHPASVNITQEDYATRPHFKQV